MQICKRTDSCCHPFTLETRSDVQNPQFVAQAEFIAQRLTLFHLQFRVGDNRVDAVVDYMDAGRIDAVEVDDFLLPPAGVGNDRLKGRVGKHPAFQPDIGQLEGVQPGPGLVQDALAEIFPYQPDAVAAVTGPVDVLKQRSLKTEDDIHFFLPDQPAAVKGKCQGFQPPGEFCHRYTVDGKFSLRVSIPFRSKDMYFVPCGAQPPDQARHVAFGSAKGGEFVSDKGNLHVVLRIDVR